MTGTAKLTVEQYDAIDRLRSSFTPHERESLQRLVISPASVVVDGTTDTWVRVTFDAMWGSITYDITPAGESEHVVFGASAISV